MSHAQPIASFSSSNSQLIINNALDKYKKRTKNDLLAHSLATQLQSCDSPSAVLAILHQQVQWSDQSRTEPRSMERWIMTSRGSGGKMRIMPVGRSSLRGCITTRANRARCECRCGGQPRQNPVSWSGATWECRGRTRAARAWREIACSEDYKRGTPLHVAAEYGNVGVVCVLLEHGANSCAEDSERRTPLHAAAALHGSVEVVRVLLEHGANVGAKDEQG